MIQENEAVKTAGSGSSLQEVPCERTVVDGWQN